MSGIIFPECKSCNKNFIGTSTVLCGACSEQEIASLKEKVQKLEAAAKTYSQEWDASRKQASLLAEKVEQKDAKIRELETELMHKGRSYPVIKFSEILSLQAQIAVLRAGLEDAEHIINELYKPGYAVFPGSEQMEQIEKFFTKKNQALSSDGSELQEAVRFILKIAEHRWKALPIDSPEKQIISRLRGLV